MILGWFCDEVVQVTGLLARQDGRALKIVNLDWVRQHVSHGDCHFDCHEENGKTQTAKIKIQ